jgi:hypothetical protein
LLLVAEVLDRAKQDSGYSNLREDQGSPSGRVLLNSDDGDLYIAKKVEI